MKIVDLRIKQAVLELKVCQHLWYTWVEEKNFEVNTFALDAYDFINLF